MCQTSTAPSNMRARKSNYKVRFRHGVFPDLESQATRADIKKYDYFFGSEQIWVETPEKVNFVDESTQIGDDGDCPNTPGSTGGRKVYSRRVTRFRNTQTTCRPASRWRSKGMSPPLHATGSECSNGEDAHIPIYPGTCRPWYPVADVYRWEGSGPESVSSHDDIGTSTWQDDLQSQTLCQSPETGYWAIQPPQAPLEADLWCFWVDEAARWWDSTSLAGIFKRVVPVLASHNVMLRNAILMYSAQQIRRFQVNFLVNPYYYHERLLQHLLPHLAKNGRIEDEATLVAAMLLRAFEESHTGSQDQMQLSTYDIFQSREGWLFDMSNPLVQACLMMHVRFDIHHALLKESSLSIDYSEDVLEVPMLLSDDVCWENRIIWLSARILQWADKETGSISEWCGLAALVDEWELTRPASFTAFTCDGRDPEYPSYFPELFLSSPYHAAANVYLQICRMALAVHNPAGHWASISTANPILSMQYEVLRGLKTVVASTRCDKYAVSTTLVAAHTIHRFAAILSDDFDRQRMIDFLEEVDAMGWWATRASIMWLRKQWRQDTCSERTGNLVVTQNTE